MLLSRSNRLGVELSPAREPLQGLWAVKVAGRGRTLCAW